MTCWICGLTMGLASVTYSWNDRREWWYCARCNYRNLTERPPRRDVAGKLLDPVAGDPTTRGAARA